MSEDNGAIKVTLEELFPKIENLYEFVSIHREMLSDPLRIRSYATSISEIVRPGDLVVDIGTGTGILAFLSLFAGAKRVYAIERTHIIELAKQIALQNGFDGRITFIHGDSKEIDLPEKVDVIISELIGHIVLEENMLDSVIDARKRFLKRDGKIIPRAIEIMVAPVNSEQIYEQEVRFWDKKIADIDFSPVKTLAVNNIYITDIKPESLICDPKIVASFDLESADESNLLSKTVFHVRKRNILHGFAGWFETELSPNVDLSSSPYAGQTHWQQCFFPIEKPIEVNPGNRIEFAFTVTSLGNDIKIDWMIEVSESNKGVKMKSSSYQYSTSRVNLK